MRSEYTANLEMARKTETMDQVEHNRRVRAQVAKIRAEKARVAGKKNWWRV